ncbi:MAG: hypothetical protein OEV64_09540 [Desulfobulbaceae bacterium]|nr:hypothetical protein [Desulfobulbaceae bacterium]
MKEQDEIRFLKQFREKICEYLFLECSPPEFFTYTQGRDVETIKKSLQQQKEMKEAQKKSEFQQLKKEIEKMKGPVHKILSRCEVSCILTQYPQKNMGGPILRFELMDLITENKTRSTIRLNTFTNKIDEAIKRLEEIINPPPKVDEQPATAADAMNLAAFIIMALNLKDPTQEKTRDFIVEALQEVGLRAEMTNGWSEMEMVSQSVLEQVKAAHLIIADLTNNKPQVYYNAGYGQALGKIVVYIAKKGSKIKIDLPDSDIIYYSNPPHLKAQFKKKINALEWKLRPVSHP